MSCRLVSAFVTQHLMDVADALSIRHILERRCCKGKAKHAHARNGTVLRRGKEGRARGLWRRWLFVQGIWICDLWFPPDPSSGQISLPPTHSLFLSRPLFLSLLLTLRASFLPSICSLPHSSSLPFPLFLSVSLLPFPSLPTS